MKPLLIGITGGIGVGKSLVAHIFEVLGTPIYNADNQAKFLLNNDLTLKQNIINAFGEESYQDEQLNRDHIAKIVFNNQEKLNLLNSIVHPCVDQDFQQWCNKYQNTPYLLKEAALLYETGGYQKLDYMIVVDAPLELRIQRIRQRDPFRSEEEVKNIIQKQMPNEDKVSKADFVLLNDEKNMVIQQILTIHQQFLKK